MWDVTHTDGAFYKTIPQDSKPYESARKWRRHVALIQQISKPETYAAIKAKPEARPAHKFPGYNNENWELEKIVASRQKAKTISDEKFAELREAHELEERTRRNEQKAAKKKEAVTGQPQEKSRRAKRTPNEADTDQPGPSTSTGPPSKRPRNEPAEPLPNEIDLLPEVAARQLSSLPEHLIATVLPQALITPFSDFFDPKEPLRRWVPNYDKIKEAISAENMRKIKQSKLQPFTHFHIFKFC